MSGPTLKQYGFFAICDSGPPLGHGDYTTLIIFHGLQFHSDLKIRLVTVNRPGYPGATPLSEAERKELDDVSEGRVTDTELAVVAVLDHIKAGAKKAYDFLVQFVAAEDIPACGRIIIAGWSFGATTVLGLLAYGDEFATKEFSLCSHVKHVVLYDPPSVILGYYPPPNFCNPLTDPLLTQEELPKAFSLWVSGHYEHGDDFSTLRCRYAEALPDPLPTALSMDPSEVRSCLEDSSMLPTGGSDAQVLILGATHGAFARLKDAVLRQRGVSEPGCSLNSWDNVTIKYIWCDRSAWEMPWGAICLQKELTKDNKDVPRRRVDRNVVMVRLTGANHLYHWEHPGQAIKELLSDP